MSSSSANESIVSAGTPTTDNSDTGSDTEFSSSSGCSSSQGSYSSTAHSDSSASSATTTTTKQLGSTSTSTLESDVFVERTLPSLFAGRVSAYYYTLFVDLWAAAGPIIASYFFQMLMRIISVLFVGRMGPEILGGFALGSMFQAITGHAIIVGMGTAIETLCSNAFGAGQKKVVGEHIQRSLTSMYGASVLMCILWSQTKRSLILIGMNPDAAAIAQTFVLWSIPFMLSIILLEIARKFMVAQGENTPVTVAMAVADVAHLGVTALFVFGFGMGYKGVALAGVFSNIVALCVIYVHIRRKNLFDGVWGGWDWRVACDVAPFLRLALPGVGMVGFEWWAMELCTLAAGLLPGFVPLGAQLLISNTVVVSFMMSMGMGIAAANICGNFLGASRPTLARDTFYIATGSAIVTSTLIGVALLALRNVWGFIYTNDPRVVAAVGAVLPIVALFQVIGGVQDVTSGVLRSCGFQKYGAALSVVGYYVLGLPVGITLAFVAGLGVAGLWWGVCVAITFMASVNTTILLNTNWEKQAVRARQRSRVAALCDESADSSGGGGGVGDVEAADA